MKSIKLLMATAIILFATIANGQTNKGKGVNWLSLEKKVKYPYYGNQMLTCGKVVLTIQ